MMMTSVNGTMEHEFFSTQVTLAWVLMCIHSKQVHLLMTAMSQSVVYVDKL